MKKQLPYSIFKIHCYVYDFDILFCISKDYERAIKYVNLKLELPTDDIAPRKVETIKSCNGHIFHRTGYVPIVWLPEEPKTPSDFGVLSHEIFHVVCIITRWACITLSQDSEEAFCHLIKYITKEALKKLDKI